MINLFCLPFAGGTSYSYNIFKQFSSDKLQIFPLELPGRGKRFEEPMAENIQELVDDCYNQVKGSLEQPYALFGHSMGALLSYQLLKKISKSEDPLPLQLFVSGFAGPSVAMTEGRKKMHSEEELIHKLRMMDMQADIVDHEVFRSFYEPVIRADLMLLKNYTYQQDPPFPVGVTVFIGESDDIPEEEVKAWQLESSRPIKVYHFEGKHHFWRNKADQIFSVINNALELY